MKHTVSWNIYVGFLSVDIWYSAWTVFESKSTFQIFFEDLNKMQVLKKVSANPVLTKSEQCT